MGKQILVPVDGSDQARTACEFAIEEFPEADLVLLHVINPADAGYSVQASIPTFSEEWYERQKQQAQERFDEIEADANERGIDVESVIEVGKPTHVIVEYVENNDIDQIVMGSHGRSGVSRILLGSVAETVVRRSPVPVTVIR
ncbi:universal stress protein [Halorhabdus sp. CBA1104]|uniref:universal stress protein n=1 Tax=unclassified Halorhabdus TaxID=2621901 RepID=UPI0012B1996F|nr:MULTISPECIES: universal stress protein [unclassified Halorhabdus]QGN06241.1 universal stress protein [Halorhabdus sp. CBA1104]